MNILTKTFTLAALLFISSSAWANPLAKNNFTFTQLKQELWYTGINLQAKPVKEAKKEEKAQKSNKPLPEELSKALKKLN
jgi:hypothetical protein